MKQVSMKIIYTVIFLSLFLFNTLHAQPEISIGANIGYTGLDMKDVNDSFKKGEEDIKSRYSNYSVSREDVGGGLYFDGNFLLTFNKSFTTGLSVNYISSSVEFSGEINGGPFSNKYDFSTIEIMGVLGYKIAVSNTMSLPLRGLVGYGIPSTDIDNPNGKFEGSGGYFAARAQVGIEFDLKVVTLNAFLGYRIANAGALDFKTSDGDDTEILNADGNEMEFDYSGLLVGAGLSFNL